MGDDRKIGVRRASKGIEIRFPVTNCIQVIDLTLLDAKLLVAMLQTAIQKNPRR